MESTGPENELLAGFADEVHLDAYFRNEEPPVMTDNVKVVSADVLSDPRTGVRYYSVQVTVPASGLKKLGALKVNPVVAFQPVASGPPYFDLSLKIRAALLQTLSPLVVG